MPESQKKENRGSSSNEHKQVGKREEKLPYDYLVVSYGSEQCRFAVSERFFNPVVKAI
jgi:NADH dehydrogenase FAD-containing subunit